MSKMYLPVRHSCCCRLLLLLFFVVSPPCNVVVVVDAWGKVGHEIVGNVAWEWLNDDTRLTVQTILAPHVNTTSTLSYLGAVADWADVVRYTHDYAWSGPLHYIDVQDKTLPASCTLVGRGFHHHDKDATCDFVWTRDCGPDNWCVAGAIQNYTHRLVMNDDDATTTTSATATAIKEEALKFVTHFVGDIHQPLHVSRSTDRGGNSITVHADFHKTNTVTTTTTTSRRRHRHRRLGPYDSANQHLRASRRTRDITTTLLSNQHHHHTNLHGVWDDVLLETYQAEECNHDWTHVQAQVYNITQAAQADGRYQKWTQCADGRRHVCLDTWAQEAWELAQDMAYRHVNGTQIQSNDHLSRKYYESRIPVVLEQLAKASVRLAWTLTWHLTGTIVGGDGMAVVK